MELSKIVQEDVLFILIGLDNERAKNLPSNIVGIEHLSSAVDLAKIYSCADVLINPTYEDNFPTVNLEALACGTPVITYRTGGSPEAVDDHTGIVVNKGDVQSLKEALVEIRRYDRKELTKMCRERAERLYNNKYTYNDYIETYKMILNETDREY